MTESRMPHSDSADASADDVVDAEIVDDGAGSGVSAGSGADAGSGVNAGSGVDAESGDGSDPVNTEAVNDPQGVDPAAAGAAPAGSAGAGPAGTAGAGSSGAGSAPGQADLASASDAELAAQRLEDLQRLNAEYVNYKRRVDRDREVVQQRAVSQVLESLLPVLDDIHLAREHGDLTGPFAAIADKLEASLGKFGLETFGAVGEAFDPTQHEALMHGPWDSTRDDLPADADTTTVVQVLQPGYRTGDQVIRPARVAVADPE